jgi:DNA invertase Pin-like site-specific DNA recombinase
MKPDLNVRAQDDQDVDGVPDTNMREPEDDDVNGVPDLNMSLQDDQDVDDVPAVNIRAPDDQDVNRVPDLNMRQPDDQDVDGVPDTNMRAPDEQDIDGEPGGEHVGGERPSHADLPETHKYAAYIALKALGIVQNRKIGMKDKQLVAILLKTSVRSVERIWRHAKQQEKRNEEINFSNKRKGRCGRKRKNLELSRTRLIALNKRQTLRALARALDIPYATLQRRLKWGELRRHTSSIKPALKQENKISRLKFCISMLDETTLANETPSFKNMQNIVHIDEKWFDMTKRKRTYYLEQEETNPVRTIHNKNSIGKVMFLSAVARPRIDETGHVKFDGKIGVWRLSKKLRPKRTPRTGPKERWS